MTNFTGTWLQFLTQFNARISDEAAPEVLGFGAVPEQDCPPDNFVTPLIDLGLMAVSGADAASFLHTQLTNDVEHLGLEEVRLAGYCSPKGRLLATFLLWRSTDTIMLQIPRSILAAVQKRMQMFVLRSKAKLVDVGDSQVALGLAGPAVASVLKTWFVTIPAAPYAKVDGPFGTLIRTPDASGQPRYLWVADVELAKQAWPTLIESLQPVGTHAWRLTDIRAGIPVITQATQEQFVPQMINFEVIGGVNFKKGCYPGQEIVARSQYLGKLKRRMMPATVESREAKAGMEVFSHSDPEQPCGMIVNAEPCSATHMDCLVALKTSVLEEAATIHLGSDGGPVLQFKPLPYLLLDPT